VRKKDWKIGPLKALTKGSYEENGFHIDRASVPLAHTRHRPRSWPLTRHDVGAMGPW
jgi:hypothetical protein